MNADNVPTSEQRIQDVDAALRLNGSYRTTLRRDEDLKVNLRTLNDLLDLRLRLMRIVKGTTAHQPPGHSG